MSDDKKCVDCCTAYDSDIADLRARVYFAEQVLISVYERLAALEKAGNNA